jgi:hypothetical protein
MGDNNRGERLEFHDKQRIDDKLAYSGWVYSRWIYSG